MSKSDRPGGPRIHFKRIVAPFLLITSALVFLSWQASIQSAVAQQQQPAQPAADLGAVRDNNFGVSLMNRQQFEDALAKFQAACARGPKTAIPCVNVGIALFNLQKYDEARQILKAIVDLDPQNARAWFNLGLLDKASGDSDASLADFTRVTEIVAEDADSRYFVGLLYSQQGQYDKAIASFCEALARNPLHLSAEFGLAQAERRSGDVASAKEHLELFEHINAEKLAAPIGSAYGEQGNYSLVSSMMPAPEPVPAAIPVHFVDVTSLAGIASASPRGTPLPNSTLANFLGSGACVIDYDGDGKPDIFVLDADGRGDAALYHNVGGGKFVDVTKSSGLNLHGEGTGCAVGDYDNDGKPDLAVAWNGHLLLFHNEGNGVFKDVTEKVGIKTEGLLLGITFVDYDHDGDLDLYVTRFANLPLSDPSQPFAFPADAHSPGNVLWRNNGNGTFTDWTSEAGLEGSGPSVGVIASDINNDRAIDFIVTGWQKSPAALLNPREGKFKAMTPWTSDMPAPTAGAVALDFDKDGWMDLAFTHWGAPGLSLWRNVGGKSFERVPLPDLGWQRAWGVAAIDYDNDGWIDLVAVGETKSGEGRIALLRNEGPAGFRDVTHDVGLDKIVLHNPRSVIAFDYDGDSAVDLLITQNNLPPVLLRNDGGARNNWLQVALKGLHDNATGIGTRVEIFSGALQQKWEVPGASGYLGQGSAEIHAGLGSEQQVDIVRMLWPTGVLQDELDISAGKRNEISEIDRRGSSCPIVFVWNGKKFEFLADMIGPGIVGHWIGPNQRNTPDPEEYFRVAGSQVELRAGHILFRMIEPMEELDYLDRVRLLAVDHPADVEVYPNEYFASNPPFPKFKVIASHGAHTPVGAWDDQGHDVLPLLLKRDGKYVTDLPNAPYQGFTGMHSLTLDLGSWDASRPLQLLMDGFTDYFSANSMYAAWQAGIQPVAPYVEAQNSSGNWVRVVDDMGFPAGLARTMVADLTGKLPAGTRKIRITTNLRIYWDRIRIDNSAPDLAYRVSEAPLSAANLSFRGYPRVVEGEPRNNISYIYEDVSPSGPYTRQTGNYTRYGDVTDLVRASDDEYAIFGSGDEVAVDFDAALLPALPAGWTRDYFFYADGFAKDMDFYAAHGDTVAPLPFHTLVPYPYANGISYPQDDAHLKYLLEYNTRGVAGPASPSFKFDYPAKSQ
ncbi:MAG: FG-GAP-like repeat-containing protein [Candidatus Acidiferrales bacterium]|jgi:Tfp pilus assembly protein PilF